MDESTALCSAYVDAPKVAGESMVTAWMGCENWLNVIASGNVTDSITVEPLITHA